MSPAAAAPREQAQSVLVIDDAKDIHDLVAARLRPEGVRLLHAFDSDRGLALAREERPDLVLLDLDLDGRSGLDVCRALRADPRLAAIPVIFLTGTVDVATKVQAFDAGAIDYVTKPFDGVELRARVRAALRTKRFFDLLTTRAQLDPMTGLWNRAYFDARLGDEVEALARGRRRLALVIVDIDQFKAMTEAYGHPFADLVLRRVADVIASALRPDDVACRYGGEAFGALLRDATLADAELVTEQLLAGVAALDLRQGGARVPVTVSIGYVSSDKLEEGAELTPAALVAKADRGLFLARRTGRNRACRGDREAGVLQDTMLVGSGAPVRPEDRASGTCLGPYEILAVIGGGGMGTVYRALDRRLLREVALKVLTDGSLRDPDGWRRFAQEARALAALDHPNIVRVFDFGRSDEGEQYLVLELLEGSTVRRRIEQGPLPDREALGRTLELVRALGVAHEKGIVHRDLKPENLFLTTDGALKILDFGIAKITTPLFGARATGADTQTGVLLGTVGYLSPEQARGEAVDGRSDLFAVGAILYELVTGERAFNKATAVETLHAILTYDPPPVGRPAIDRILRACLMKEPEHRVRNAAELKQLLVEQIARG